MTQTSFSGVKAPHGHHGMRDVVGPDFPEAERGLSPEHQDAFRTHACHWCILSPKSKHQNKEWVFLGMRLSLFYGNLHQKIVRMLGCGFYSGAARVNGTRLLIGGDVETAVRPRTRRVPDFLELREELLHERL